LLGGRKRIFESHAEFQVSKGCMQLARVFISAQIGETGSLTFPVTPIYVACLRAANHAICAPVTETVYITGAKCLELKRN
jgi:hypothetical protein